MGCQFTAGSRWAMRIRAEQTSWITAPCQSIFGAMMGGYDGQKASKMTGHFLIVEARFYSDLADALAAGAEAALSAAGASFERLSVPGALEIPPAISLAAASGKKFDGYVALGCVIRGETSHYETVCNESARGLMELGISQHLAIGNGIITVENSDQAWARADASRKDKGGDAARAALALAQMKADFNV